MIIRRFFSINRSEVRQEFIIHLLYNPLSSDQLPLSTPFVVDHCINWLCFFISMTQYEIRRKRRLALFFQLATKEQSHKETKIWLYEKLCDIGVPGGEKNEFVISHLADQVYAIISFQIKQYVNYFTFKLALFLQLPSYNK